MKSTEVSHILARKFSPTSNVSLSKEVSESAVEVGTSASSCEFMSCLYFNNCNNNNNNNNNNIWLFPPFADFSELQVGSGKAHYKHTVININI